MAGSILHLKLNCPTSDKPDGQDDECGVFLKPSFENRFDFQQLVENFKTA